VQAFNERQDRERPAPEGDEPVGGGAVVDAVELKADTADRIDLALEMVPDDLYPFVELPSAKDPRGLLAALAGGEAGAKIRTGGVTADAIPPAEHVARFIAACNNAGIPFKATAGLHHPCRGEFALTYDADPPRGRMHGFLNVFVAAVALRAGASEQDALRVLEAGPKEFAFTEQGLSVMGRRIALEVIEAARASFATSFGSCSFEEPVEDLKAMSLLSGGPAAGALEGKRSV
jgi:hypothetical protein